MWVHVPNTTTRPLSVCSVASAGASWAGCCSGGSRCAPLKSIRSVKTFCDGECGTAGSRISRSGRMCAPSTGNPGRRISSPPGSRASRTASTADNRPTRTNATSGNQQRSASARYSRRSRSWKTSQRSLLDSGESSPDWTKSGLMRSGRAFLQGRSMPPTVEIAGGVWPSTGRWPTPRKSTYKGVGPLGSKSHRHRLDRSYLDATVQEHEQATGKLNPRFLEWMMGWPIGWTERRPSGTESCHSRWRSRSVGLLKSLLNSCSDNEG